MDRKPVPGKGTSENDPRRLIRTGTPGVYKRIGSNGQAAGYVAIFRAGGRQRKRVARTLAEARALKRESETDHDRGEFQPRTNVTFREFLAEWIDSYNGTGRRGFREGTRAEYRRLLDRFAHVYFPERLRLVDLTPRHLSQYVSWLANEKGLADSSVENAVVPVRAALATARRDGLLRHNPATALALPHRPSADGDDAEEVTALSREQLAALIAMAPERYRLLLRLLASTGLRISEAIAPQRKHLMLDGSKPHVRVRRASVKRRIVPPKTRYGKREVPLSPDLVGLLRQQLGGLADESADALVFPSMRGTPLDPDTMRRNMLRPLMEEIDMAGAGFHAIRHTFASLQLANGVNMLALSRALGHHSPAFTLNTYCHLLHGDEAPALELDRELDLRYEDDHAEALDRMGPIIAIG